MTPGIAGIIAAAHGGNYHPPVLQSLRLAGPLNYALTSMGFPAVQLSVGPLPITAISLVGITPPLVQLSVARLPGPSNYALTLLVTS